MIDGVKIGLLNDLEKVWGRNKLLNFVTKIDYSTGEIINGVRVAKYWGLSFIIKPNRNGTGFYCSVRGSLHTYKNRGKHNADVFTFDDLQNVIKDLQNKFNIDPKRAVLNGLEYGVNINTLAPVKKLLGGFVSYSNKTFDTLWTNKKAIGICIKSQRYTVKLYDKGVQFKINNNLLRFEYSIIKMEHLKKYNIKTLHDLTQRDKIKPLGACLFSFLDDCVYYDKKAYEWRKMTNSQHKRVLYYARPNNWADYTPQQRKRAKETFNRLNNKFCTSTIKQELTQETVKMWDLLTAKKCICFNHSKTKIYSIKNVYDLTVKIKSYNIYKNTPEIKSNNINQNTVKNTPIYSDIVKPKEKRKREKPKKSARVCRCCGSDITHKKVTAFYCSKRCNNKINGMIRNRNKKKKRKAENLGIEKVLKWINRGVSVWICVQSDTESVTLTPSEILTDNKSISEITAVRVIPKDKRYSEIYLTAGRGRKLIRKLNRNNKINAVHYEN